MIAYVLPSNFIYTQALLGILHGLTIPAHKYSSRIIFAVITVKPTSDMLISSRFTNRVQPAINIQIVKNKIAAIFAGSPNKFTQIACVTLLLGL